MAHRWVLLLGAACGTETPEAPVAARVQWRGGPTVLVERDGFRLLTDPMLGPREREAFVLPRHPSTGVENAPVARYTEPPAEPLGTLDLVILSHGHADHWDDTARRVLPKDLSFVLPPDTVDAATAAGFTRLHPLGWGESTSFPTDTGELRITAVQAEHSHDGELDASLGRGNGYLLEWQGSRDWTVYWTGDAVFGDAMRDVAERYAPIDLWLPHLGAVGMDGARGLRTMDADEAVAAAASLRPRQVMPIHHTTFGHYREPVTAFSQAAAAKGLPAAIHVPVDGAWWMPSSR